MTRLGAEGSTSFPQFSRGCVTYTVSHPEQNGYILSPTNVRCCGSASGLYERRRWVSTGPRYASITEVHFCSCNYGLPLRGRCGKFLVKEIFTRRGSHYKCDASTDLTKSYILYPDCRHCSRSDRDRKKPHQPSEI